MVFYRSDATPLCSMADTLPYGTTFLFSSMDFPLSIQVLPSEADLPWCLSYILTVVFFLWANGRQGVLLSPAHSPPAYLPTRCWLSLCHSYGPLVNSYLHSRIPCPAVPSWATVFPHVHSTSVSLYLPANFHALELSQHHPCESALVHYSSHILTQRKLWLLSLEKAFHFLSHLKIPVGLSSLFDFYLFLTGVNLWF